MISSSELIRVRRLPSGVIRIGTVVVGAAGVSRINLPGSTLLYDPLTPRAVPTIEVADVASSAESVGALLGANVVDAMGELSRPDADAVVFDVVPVPSSRLAQLRALGYALWLTETCPWPLPEQLLGAQLVAAASSCLDLLEGREEVRRSLAALAGSLWEVLAAAVSVDTNPDALSVLVTAAHGVADQLPFGDPLHLALEDVVGLAEVAAAPEMNVLDDLLRMCVPHGSAHAGADTAILYAGSATADPSRNSSGLISGEEDAITWTVEISASRRADITVVGSRPPYPRQPAPTPLPELAISSLLGALTGTRRRGPVRQVACSIHVPSWPIAVAEMALAPFGERGSLTGRVTLDGPAADLVIGALTAGTLTIDVHDIGYRFAHLIAPDPTVESARRWSARAVCATRLALAAASPELEFAARAAWTQAMALWGYTRTAPGGSDLATARRRLCGGWLALLEGSDGDLSTDLDMPSAVTVDDREAISATITVAETYAS